MRGPILVPHDLTADADAALRAADELPYPGAPRVVVHVLPRIDPKVPGGVWSVDDDDPRRQHAARALARHTTGLLPEAALQVVIGDPGTRIVELARQLGARLIVMPSHGRRGPERPALGSVSEHVTRFAPCPVLVLPAATAGSPADARERPQGNDRTRAEQMDALGAEICAQVDAHVGACLTALRVGLPAEEDLAWWEQALVQRLATAGVAFVDLVFAAAPRPTLLAARFEPGFA